MKKSIIALIVLLTLVCSLPARAETSGVLSIVVDKNPSYREIPLSTDNFIESFILFEHQNN